jgi:hypothetical protein
LIASTLFFGYCREGTSQSDLLNHKQKENNMEIMETQISNKDSEQIYFLQFDNDLSNLKFEENFNLSFLPRFIHDEKLVVELETIHEKKTHIIIVSEDLEHFSHIHPDKEVNGEYSVKVNLPFGGKFILFIEYKPKGSNKITERFNLFVEGTGKSKAVFKNERYHFEDQNLSVLLRPAEDLFSGNEIHIPVAIFKDGKELNATNFDNYLGEKAHAVLIGITNFNFLHVHPMVMNNQLNLHMNIVKSGYYRLWLQFQIDGILYTTDYVLEAKPSNQLNEKPNHNQHKH